MPIAGGPWISGTGRSCDGRGQPYRSGRRSSAGGKNSGEEPGPAIYWQHDRSCVSFCAIQEGARIPNVSARLNGSTMHSLNISDVNRTTGSRDAALLFQQISDLLDKAIDIAGSRDRKPKVKIWLSARD